MIVLTLNVDNISSVMQVYDQIQLQRSESENGTYTTISGLGPVTLATSLTSYAVTDTAGTSNNWYMSRYYSTFTGSYSAWSDPVLGQEGDLFYNPLYPEEIAYGTTEQLTIDRIRRLIGDPKNIRRDFGEEALSSMHDNRVYELEEVGWPAAITIANTQYNHTSNPTVNGYKYLRFNSNIDTETTISGVDYSIDIWYYTFRNSDRQIMDAYDNCPPPLPLSTTTATTEAYMLQTAIDILRQELWEDATENGAAIKDEGSTYDPEPGLKIRRALLDGLKNKLDDLVKVLMLSEITGVLID